MRRVLVEIMIPAIGKSYDLYLPEGVKISEVVSTMSDMLSETDGNFYCPTEDAVLCDRKTGQAYSNSMSIDEMDMFNGKKFMLI